MPYFSVMIHGAGIKVPTQALVDDGDAQDAPAIGFHTTRVVLAKSPASAKEKVTEMIRKEWTDGPYAEANRGKTPRLAVESVDEIGLINGILFRNRGYSFYQHEDDDSDA